MKKETESITRSAIIVEINTKDVKLVKTNVSSLRSKRHSQSISLFTVNKEILCKCLLERKDKILVFTNFTSLVLISTMIALLVILFIIKLYAQNNKFEETESLILAVQNQIIRTNLGQGKIDKSQGDSLCRVCRKVDESIDHSVSVCSKLAQKEWKRKHDNLGKTVHRKLTRKCNFEAGDKWYEHESESILENEDYKIL